MSAGPSLPCQLVTLNQEAPSAALGGSSWTVPVATRPSGVFCTFRSRVARTPGPAVTGIQKAITPTAATAADGQDRARDPLAADAPPG